MSIEADQAITMVMKPEPQGDCGSTPHLIVRGYFYIRAGITQDWKVMRGIWGYTRYYLREDRKVIKLIFLFFMPNFALILFL